MSRPLSQSSLAVTPTGAVIIQGSRYRQHPVASPPKPAVDHVCYFCAAYRNMGLCEGLCPYCRLGHVFIRDACVIPKKTTR